MCALSVDCKEVLIEIVSTSAVEYVGYGMQDLCTQCFLLYFQAISSRRGEEQDKRIDSNKKTRLTVNVLGVK